MRTENIRDATPHCYHIKLLAQTNVSSLRVCSIHVNLFSFIQILTSTTITPTALHEFIRPPPPPPIKLDPVGDQSAGLSLRGNHTSSGRRSKVLPPIVKDTTGSEERFPQSTDDSPIGLGTLSQSCNIIMKL